MIGRNSNINDDNYHTNINDIIIIDDNSSNASIDNANDNDSKIEEYRI